MKRTHHKKLKLHTIFSTLVAILMLGVVLFSREFALAGALTLLVLYIAGNGILHTKHTFLHRDTLLEYVLIALVAAVVIFGALF